MKIIVNIALLFFVIIGLAGFFGLDFLNSRANNNNAELPLSDIQGIAVDSLDNIYLGLGIFGKVQIYDKNGNFIKSWDVQSNGGAFYIGISEDDNIAIYSVRADEKNIYDKNGNILSQSKFEIDYLKFEKSAKIFTSKKGNKYEISGWFPKIKKDGKIIIKQNLILTLLTEPQSLVMSLLGIVLLVIINIKKLSELIFNYRGH